MKAIIMAGGQGTRLRPLTCGVPKPLAKLCGRPVVCYILDLLERHGFTEAVFTLGYKAEQIEQFFETGRYKNLILRFSREDSPLGTAGCVKKALANVRGVKSSPNEPFVVISGDALCDFDLTAVVDYHRSVNAAATIITKRVQDPREYGLVLTDGGRIEAGGEVLGFSEKPSYLSCIDDCANTGVYVLSPQVLELVPDGVACDFARDVFPKMQQYEQRLYSYEENGYWCDIGDFATYRQSQFDLAAGRVGSAVVEGIDENSNCIGQNVTIGDNCTITSSIIGDNVNIGNNVKVKDSVILDCSYISDGVNINQAIICANTKIMQAASVFEEAVIGEGCLIGREAIVCGGVRIWNGKSVANGANVTRDIKYGCKKAAELSDCGITGETNADITPELCTNLGAALSAVSKIVAVSCENNNASIAMKHAVLAGISGAGGNAFDVGSTSLPQLIYAANLLGCSVIARVKCAVKAQIEILGKGGLPLTRLQERGLQAALSRGEFKSADWNGFGSIEKIEYFDRLYTNMLYNYARFKSAYRVKINCDNRGIVPIFDSICTKGGEILIVALTDGGSKAEIYTESNIKISYEQLILLAAARLMRSGFDAALPNEFAGCADLIAESYGRKVHRYFLCSNDSGDAHARELAAAQPFLRDGAILALNVLQEIAERDVTIEAAVKALPVFASVRREVEINCPPQRIISRLCSQGACGKGEGVLCGDSHHNVLIRSSKRGNSLHLLAESLSSETAAELCENTEKMIRKLIDENS
jgi:mannose-1-phosphate guanylyltransferase/phosphomannomutase